MQHAVCNTQCAVCSVQYLLCRPEPAVLPHLLSEALLSVIDGCGLLAVDLLGQSVGPVVHRVIIQGEGMILGAGALVQAAHQNSMIRSSPGPPSKMSFLSIALKASEPTQLSHLWSR